MIAIVVFSMLILRVGWLQLVEGDRLRDEAMDVRMRDVPLEAKRGTIYDRNGHELVTSVSVDSAYAFPPQIEDKQEAAEKIAQVLQMDKEVVYEKLTEKVGFVWLKRRIDFDVAQELKSLGISGVELVEENRRFYHQDSLAAHILGFAGDDNQGLTGIEAVFDQELRGIPGRIVIEKDAVGQNIPEAYAMLRGNFAPPRPFR